MLPAALAKKRTSTRVPFERVPQTRAVQDDWRVGDGQPSEYWVRMWTSQSGQPVGEVKLDAAFYRAHGYHLWRPGSDATKYRSLYEFH